MLDREWLSVHTVRVTVGGSGFDALRMNEFTDKYAKLNFVDRGLRLTPPYDLRILRESLQPDRRPVTRTYTCGESTCGASSSRSTSWSTTLKGKLREMRHSTIVQAS